MSGATYRIEIEHIPGELFPYYGRVLRLSDEIGMPAYTKHGDDPELVEEACRGWIAMQNHKQDTRTVYVDDFGQDAEAHSVKA